MSMKTEWKRNQNIIWGGKGKDRVLLNKFFYQFESWEEALEGCAMKDLKELVQVTEKCELIL